MYDVVTFVGRFQPFHQGHVNVVARALKGGKKVNISLGSHGQAISARNPFTTAERIKMISSAFPDEVRSGRVFFSPQVDYRYNLRRWIVGIESNALAVSQQPFNPDPVKMALIGHSKDKSSFYLKCFPTWDSIEVRNFGGIDATAIRQMLFTGVEGWERLVPDSVADFLKQWKNSSNFAHLQEENEHVEDYKKQWANSPYPPIFQTVDAVVTQSGHILMVERKDMPGRGLWALPGGFVNQYETLENAVLRELREETNIAISDETLLRTVKSFRTFDDPWRSQRGRTITTAYHFDLRMGTSLTDVYGGDDAKQAKWIPISELLKSPETIFEDHAEIISEMTGVW